MPMQSQTKERIYLLVMVFCLLMCAVLLISVFCDLPIAAIGPANALHAPVMRTGVVDGTDLGSVHPGGGGGGGTPAAAQGPQTTEQGVAVTQEYLQVQMQSFIPQSFPATELEVEIEAGGSFELELVMHKDDMKQYLESCGVSMGLKQNLAMGLLPDAMAVEAVLQCTGADRAGVQLSVEALSVNDKSVEPDFLPANIFDVLSSAINASLAYSGYEWSDVVFADGVLYLK